MKPQARQESSRVFDSQNLLVWGILALGASAATAVSIWTAPDSSSAVCLHFYLQFYRGHKF
jgi:hypothetical protein